MTNHLILLGAGFSRNWGGWLALEVFEYLLGCYELDLHTKKLLWNFKDRGGFEAVLAKLEEDSHDGKPHPRLIALNAIIARMFGEMDDGLRHIQFDPVVHQRHGIVNFLSRFDAVFSLNQDLILERHYLQHSDKESITPYLPGVFQRPDTRTSEEDLFAVKYSPDVNRFEIRERSQPIIKLHGSFNWIDESSHNLVIIGGNKSSSIARSPLLNWYHREFKSRLEQPNGKLLIIGYSFGDEHINNAILDAVVKARLRIFIIDPRGLDAIQRSQGELISGSTPFANKIRPAIIGGSRRPLRETFEGNTIERHKILKFFTS